MDLTAESKSTQDQYEAQELVPGSFLNPLDRKRMLGHVVADLTHRVLSAPSPNPAGLTITVQLVAGDGSESPPDLLVTATCPKYELDEDFFTE